MSNELNENTFNENIEQNSNQETSRNIMRCPVCETAVDMGNETRGFCPNCGSLLETNQQEETQDPALERYMEKKREEARYQYKAIPDEPVTKEKSGRSMAGIICLFLVLTLLLSAVSSFIAVKVALKNQGNGNQIVVYENNSTNTAIKSDYLDVSEVVAGIENTVVEVYTEAVAYSAFYGSYITEGAGSGVIITEDGYIVTNNHVIENARTIHVKMHDGKELEAKLIATDAKSDLAVLKVETEEKLQPAVLGNSDMLKVGQACIAIGNPLGTLGGTVTSGIISALSREIKIDGQQMTLLQTNTAINPGNSGGGLFDLNGNLIGIVNAKSSGENIEGIGFAIPVNECKEIVFQLINNGYVLGRPQLGINCTSIESIQLARQYNVNSYGVYVNELISEEAIESGLKEGDLIIGLGDYTVSGFSSLRNALNHYTAGDTVTLTILRDRLQMQIDIKLTQKTSS